MEIPDVTTEFVVEGVLIMTVGSVGIFLNMIRSQQYFSHLTPSEGINLREKWVFITIKYTFFKKHEEGYRVLNEKVLKDERVKFQVKFLDKVKHFYFHFQSRNVMQLIPWTRIL